MRDVRRPCCISLMLLAAFLFPFFPLMAQKGTVRIGTVSDGPWERNLQIRSAFQREITQLLQGEYEVRFPRSSQTIADWTVEGVRRAVDTTLADPQVDYVLALGVLSSNEVAHREVLPKPVIAPYILQPELQGIPYLLREREVAGRATVETYHVSGVTNLSYVDVRTSILREVSVFREIVPFQHMTLLSMQAFAEALPQLRDRVVEELRPLGVEIDVVGVRDSLDQALAAIPAETQAVYVAPLLQLPPGDFDRLAGSLIERGLPSFSVWGQSEVRRGLLASVALDRFDVEGDSNRLARRVALNLHRILRGERAQDLPVDFEQRERLTINMATARAIGVYPSFALLTEAVLLNDARTQATRNLSLAGVIREASTANLDLAAADRGLAVGHRLVDEAESRLRPQLSLSGGGRFIDGDRAAASFGSLGQRQISGSAQLSQILFSDQARAGYEIEQRLQEVRDEARAELRLDVILEASQTYLRVLQAKTVERIQRDNLELTRSNLEVTRSRVELGAAGPSEVYRWESEIATNRREVIEASARRNQAEIGLNRILNRPLEESFLTQETGLDDAGLVSSFQRIEPYINSPQSFDIFRDFMATEAFRSSPELAQLESAISAQRRALLASKRALYFPTVGLSADLTGFRNGGSGSAGTPLMLPGLDLSTPNALNWSVGVTATIPLFQGGLLRARRSRAELELEELTVRQAALRQRVEQRVRSALHQAGASFAGIQLSRAAATAAQRNLEVVRDAYSQGLVDILRLLDAQNQALVAELVAANAIFQYLQDLMAVQRAVGRFDYVRSSTDRQALLVRLEAYYQKVGFPIRRP